MSGRTRDCSTRSRIASVCGQNLELNIGRSAAKPRAQFEPVKMRGLPTARVAVGLLERRICLKLQKKFRLERPPGGRRGRPGRWCARWTFGQVCRGVHPVRTSDWRADAACSIDEPANKGETAMTTQGERRRGQGRWADPKGREKGTLLISTVREGKEPQGHARKRLEQAAWGLSKCYSVMSPFPSPTEATRVLMVTTEAYQYTYKCDQCGQRVEKERFESHAKPTERRRCLFPQASPPHESLALSDPLNSREGCS